MRRLLWVAVIPCALGLSSGRAQAQARDPATAETLYRVGRESAKRGDWADACAKFAESQRLDPAPGTLLNLADCEEHRGQLTAAWQHFLRAESTLPKNDARLTFAHERAAAVEKRLPHIVVRLADGAPAGTRVTRDEAELGPASFGVPLPVDPGEHVVVARADGRAEGRVVVRVGEGETRDAVVAPGAAISPSDAPAAAGAPAASSAAPESAPKTAWTKPEPGRTGRPALGWILLGVGGVGLATGAITGVLAMGRANAVKDVCGPSYLTCNSDAVANARDGKTFSTISTVSFIVGGAFAAAGAYVLIASPGIAKQIAIGVTPAGGSVGGTF